MNWFGRRTDIVISEKEGKAAASAATGVYNQSQIEKELLENQDWNNPFEDERKRVEDKRERAAELEKLAAKARQEKDNSSDGGQEYSGPSVGSLLASLFVDLMAAAGRINEYERENTEVRDGEVMDEQLALKGPKKKVPINPDNVVDGDTWPLNEKPIEQLRRQHPAGAPKTSAGTDKKRF